MHPYLPDPVGIVHELQQKGIVEADCTVSEHMKGTTNGFVCLLSVADQPTYVLKIDDPQQNYITARFLTSYGGNPLLPKLVYADPLNAYLVYTYISGSSFDSRGSKSSWLNTVTKQLIGAYVVVEAHKGWGWMDEPVDSWSDFVMERLHEAYLELGDILPEEDYTMVREVAATHMPHVLEAGDGLAEQSFWLHGDCGAHNFLFEHGELTGVIDPSPMIGPPLYDLVFAFCSSPDDLTLETLQEAAASLFSSSAEPVDPDLLIRETIVQLYCRIAICLRHHADDLPAYLDAWALWKRRMTR
jgi:hypothetical protein